LQLDGKNRATPPMAGTLTPFIAGPLAVSQSAISEIDAGIKAYR